MFRTVQESQTLLINSQSKKLKAENKEVIKFGFGQSPFLPPKTVMGALSKAAHYKEYSSVQGNGDLRELMSGFHKDHNGLNVNPGNILIAPGSKILIFNILLTFKEADILIPAPAWVSYAPQASLAGHNVIRIATSFESKWRITATAITEALKKQKHKNSILILNYPGNPDGLSYTEDELVDIANCARKSNMLVISDEIYGLLDHRLNHRSFANYYPEKTITTTGLSKWCGAGGWRFGAAFLYEEVEPEFKQALIGIGSETYSCAPSPIQVAAKEAYSSFEEIKWYIKWQTDILQQVGKYCSAKLNHANIRTHSPDGGFYLFPDFSLHQEKLKHAGISTSEHLCEKILKDTGVALLPAVAFGFSENYLAARLAYVDFYPPEEGIDFNLEKDSPTVLCGIEAIVNWVKKV